MVTATVQWDASNLFIAASVFKWQPVNLCSLNNFLEILEAPRPSFPYKCVRVLARKKRNAVNILTKQWACSPRYSHTCALLHPQGGGRRVIKTSANCISPRTKCSNFAEETRFESNRNKYNFSTSLRNTFYYTRKYMKRVIIFLMENLIIMYFNNSRCE